VVTPLASTTSHANNYDRIFKLKKENEIIPLLIRIKIFLSALP